MGFSSPKFVDSKGSSRIASGGGGGGGGGGGNPYTSFQSLPLDITNANGWTVVNGAGVNSDTSLSKDGDVLVFNQAASSNLFIQGATMNGKCIIRNNHIKMVTDAGMTQPPGLAEHLLQPEAALLRLELVFDTDGGGPINGVATGGYGNNMTCMIGLVGYGSDQGGNPTIGGNTIVWLAAQCIKNAGNQPSASTSTSLMKSGSKTYFSNSSTVTGATWKNQQGANAASHNALIFQLAPIRLQVGSGNTKADTWAGSYAKDQPWNPITTSGVNGITDNSTRYWNAASQYWHIAVWFGSSNSGVVGSIRVKEINYLLQPLVGRTSIT